MKNRTALRVSLITLTVLFALFLSLFASSAQINLSGSGASAPTLPVEIDVRGLVGVPQSTQARTPTGVQLKMVGA